MFSQHISASAVRTVPGTHTQVLVHKQTNGAYTSNHDYCRDACAVVRSQGAPV
jgi:hypothetical protein